MNDEKYNYDLWKQGQSLQDFWEEWWELEKEVEKKLETMKKYLKYLLYGITFVIIILIFFQPAISSLLLFIWLMLLFLIGTPYCVISLNQDFADDFVNLITEMALERRRKKNKTLCVKDFKD